MNPVGPKLAIPAPLRGAETGTFAHRTMTVRLSEIGRRILVENDFMAQVTDRLQMLLDELPNQAVRDLRDQEAPDWAAWQGYLVPYAGQSWLEVPWFFAETYFYRRVLEATGYFQPGPGSGVDPYAYQKRQGLETFLEPLRASCAAVNTLLFRVKNAPGELSADLVRELILMNLWGNQADLSMWPAGHAERPDHADRAGQLAHMLCNQAAQAAEYLLKSKGQLQRVDIMLDNAGLELVHDLLLADFLLASGLAWAVRLHAKSHPTFVSDAMPRDILATLAFLAQLGDGETLAVAERLNTALLMGQLQLRDHFFWTSPLSMWEMPGTLQRALGEAALVVSKGDANYRRLVGDRHWSFDTPLEDVWNYFPTSLLALRVSKSQVMVGLQPGQAGTLDRVDPQWMTDGRWGLVQFYPRK
jgi:uncharacterized protein with ATP-grasp and redox domains